MSIVSLGVGLAVLATVALAVQSLVVKVGTSQRSVPHVLLWVAVVVLAAGVVLVVGG